MAFYSTKTAPSTVLLVLVLLRLCACHLDPPPAVSHVHHSAITRRLQPEVSLNASHFSIEGDRPVYVSASWENLPSSLVDAWVGLYLANEDESQVVPLKYNFCNVSATHGISGLGGVLSFRVLNYRADVIFRLFRGWEQPVLIAQSQTVAVRVPGHPTGVRISLTAAVGEVAVTWTSTRAHAVGARVKYDVRDAAGSIVKESAEERAAATTYERGELCGAPATAEGFRDPGVFYTAKIRDLQPGFTVSYTVGSELAWSRNFSFRAPPAGGSQVKILAFGDLGEHPQDDSAQGQGEPWYSQAYAYGDPGALNTTAAMWDDHRFMPADLVLHNGDLSYAMGYSSMWEVFHDNIETLSAEIPWMVTMGNHERDWPGTGSTKFGDTDSMGECGVPTMRRFAAHPFRSSHLPPNDQPWYTLAVGSVAIVALSTEHDLASGSAQHAWLELVLGAIDRQQTPWVVLVGHRPYVVDSSWQGDGDFSTYFQAAIGNLLESHPVDLILGGHHHSYQRSCPIRESTCSEGGPVILNVGMAGAGLNAINSTMPPLFVAADDKHFGYCRIVADTATLTAEFVHSSSRTVHDSLTLRKQSDVELYA